MRMLIPSITIFFNSRHARVDGVAVLTGALIFSDTSVSFFYIAISAMAAVNTSVICTDWVRISTGALTAASTLVVHHTIITLDS